MERQDKIQIAFLILITIFIILLVFTITFLIKNKNEIIANPINYGIKIYNLNYCHCYKNNTIITFPENKRETINLSWANTK